MPPPPPFTAGAQSFSLNATGAVVKLVRPMPFALRTAALSPGVVRTTTLVPSGENDGSISPVVLLGRQVGAPLLAVANTMPIGVLAAQWVVSKMARWVPSGDQETCSSWPVSLTTTLGSPPPMGMVSTLLTPPHVLMYATVAPLGLTSDSSTQPGSAPEMAVDAPPVAGTLVRVLLLFS